MVYRLCSFQGGCSRRRRSAARSPYPLKTAGVPTVAKRSCGDIIAAQGFEKREKMVFPFKKGSKCNKNSCRCKICVVLWWCVQRCGSSAVAGCHWRKITIFTGSMMRLAGRTNALVVIVNVVLRLPRRALPLPAMTPFLSLRTM